LFYDPKLTEPKRRLLQTYRQIPFVSGSAGQRVGWVEIVGVSGHS